MLHLEKFNRCETVHFVHTIDVVEKGGNSFMSRRRGIMSEQFKEELAKELGFYDTIQKEGWGGIKAKDAGNMVKRAIELAQQNLTKS